MQNVRESIAEIMDGKDLADRASLFQMQCFILQKEPTIQGKLHQCLLELQNRRDSLDAIELEIEDQQDHMILIDIDMERASLMAPKDVLGERELSIKIRKLKRQKVAIDNQITKLLHKKKNIEEESLFWMSAFAQLSKKEDLKQWDDPDVQSEYWNEKLRAEVNLRLLLCQLPDMELMRSILSLPQDSPLKIKTVEMLQNHNKAIAKRQVDAAKLE
jgi:hypothetical protein